jgi:hypothetical protein
MTDDGGNRQIISNNYYKYAKEIKENIPMRK